MYIKKLIHNFHRPSWWSDVAVPFAKNRSARFASQMYYSPPRNASNFMKEDWDNLVILDACRYDLFTEVDYPDGELDFRVSMGSATPEFLFNIFNGETYHDTVYVTANPMYRTKNLDNVFHYVDDVWQDFWDDDKKTVRPEAMKDASIRAEKEFPNKRIISHFMQPHYPFIGELAKQIGSHSGYEKTYRQVTGDTASRDNPTVWSMLESGDVSKKVVWDAYRENLEIVLPHLVELHQNLSGKTVITSDHGNLLGEKTYPLGKPIYGHPSGYRHDGLNKVPWLEMPFEDRKTITSEPPEVNDTGQIQEVTDRLSDLGYVDV